MIGIDTVNTGTVYSWGSRILYWPRRWGPSPLPGATAPPMARSIDNKREKDRTIGKKRQER